MSRSFVRCCLLAAVAVLFAACGRQPASFHSTDITGVHYGKVMSLTDQNGQRRTLADFNGKVVAVFFGFTQCPDVCPTSLATLKEVRQRLGPDADKLQVVFVTVDPERDTPELMKQYVNAFDPSFIGLRGTAEETATAAQDFKVHFEKRGDVASGQYNVDHTAAVYIFDPQGRPRLFASHGQTPANLLADVKLLLAGK